MRQMHALGFALLVVACSCGDAAKDGANGVCRNTGTTGEGMACALDGDCPGAMMCHGSLGCGVACVDSGDCGQGSCVVNSSDDSPPASCVQACEHIAECITDVCTENIFPAIDCIPTCRDQGFADQVAALTCEEVNLLLLRQACAGDGNDACECPVFTSNVGAACEADPDCNADALETACVRERVPDTMEETGFPGGYCIALACQNDYECGADGLCVTVDSQGNTLCIRACDAAIEGSCRDGYVCSDVSEGEGVGACLPACRNDADCGTGSHCDVPSGECI